MAVAQGGFDVIALDHYMPGLGGFDTLAVLAAPTAADRLRDRVGRDAAWRWPR